MELKILNLIIFLIFTKGILAQDERFFSEKIKEQNLVKRKFDFEKFHWIALGNRYYLDLNGDGKNELLRFYKKDATDWVTIFDHNEKVILHKKLPVAGVNSKVSRIRLVGLSKNVRSLVLYYEEGVISYLNFNSRSRLILFTFDKNNFSNSNFEVGPYFTEEISSEKGSYSFRTYWLNFKDLDGNGLKDIVLKNDTIKRVGLFSSFQKGWVWP